MRELTAEGVNTLQNRDSIVPITRNTRTLNHSTTVFDLG